MRILFVIFLMLVGAMVYNMGNAQKTPEESLITIVDFIKVGVTQLGNPLYILPATA